MKAGTREGRRGENGDREEACVGRGEEEWRKGNERGETEREWQQEGSEVRGCEK